MKRPQSSPHRNTQKGVVLFVALVVLVAMSLAGISMMRTADTNTQIAGNLAFRQSALQAAEAAFEQAINKVGQITATGSAGADSSALCYTQIFMSVESPSSLPWSTNSCDLGTDTLTGNRVQLIINRLAYSQVHANSLAPAGDSPGATMKCAGSCKNYKSVYEHYRIIARVSDSKGMVTFIEEKVY
jgi:type IV pilus assembly protein PilX